MKFSTFQIMHLPEGSDCNNVIHETIDFVCRSEQLNYANVWLAEHHGSPYCINGSPSVIASAIATKTSRIGIGYAVNILPFSYPLKLVEELSMIDQLSNGRLIAGFGSGNQAGEFEMFGLDFKHRKEMAKESLEIIKRLWSNQTVTTQGKYYSLQNAKLVIKPFQTPHPPICVAVGFQGGATAMGKLSNNINLSGPASNLPEIIQAYRQACPPGFKGHVGYLRNIYVRTSNIDRDRVRNAVDVFGQLHTGNSKLNEKTINDFHSIFGIYESCCYMIEEIKELEAIGIDEILCSFRWGDLTYQEALQSMEVFAEHVQPAFQ